MQIAINTVRVLIFACSLVCLTIDAGVLSVLSTIDGDSKTNIFIYFIFNDVVSFIIGGYYILTIEKKWNSAPTKLDYTICCIEIILWLIYAILRFVNKHSGLMAVYSIIIIILYIIYAILLYQWANKLNSSGGNVPTLGRNAMNNPGPGAIMANNPNNSVGMSSPGTNSTYNPTNNSYNPMNNLYNPTNNLYNPTNNSYSPANNLYNPTSNPYNPTNNPYNPTNNPHNPTNNFYNPYNPVTGIMNNAGAERVNAGAERNNAGAERNNADVERNNAGAEYSYNQYR